MCVCVCVCVQECECMGARMHMGRRAFACVCVCFYYFESNHFFLFFCYLICSWYRYTVYRQLTRFVRGYLRKEICVILPACAMTEIRKNFPSADGTYTEYLEADWSHCFLDPEDEDHYVLFILYYTDCSCWIASVLFGWMVLKSAYNGGGAGGRCFRTVSICAMVYIEAMLTTSSTRTSTYSAHNDRLV